jgi:hypothetical protein
MSKKEVHKVYKVGKFIKSVPIAIGVTFCFMNFITFNCQAQHKNIDTIEYRVVEQANANISNGAKINSNPAIADTVKPSRKVDYTTIGNQFPTTYTPDALKPVQLKGEPLDNQQHSMLNLGGGNYNTAYLEYFFNSIRSRDWDYGIHLNHLSSTYTATNYGLSTFANNDVNLFAKKFMTNGTLTAQADYAERVVHDYGYNTMKDSLENIPSNDVTRERYNLFDGALQYSSHYKDSSKINHTTRLSYYNYSDVHNAVENNVDYSMHLYTYIQKQQIDVKLFAQYFNDVTSGDRLQSTFGDRAWNLGFNPYFSGNGKHWDARIGLKAYLDAVNGGTDVFPDLLARYHIADNALIIYAGIDGDKQYNSYKSLSTTNPFVQDTLNNQYTRTMYHLYGGFTGSITNQITYDVNASQSQIKNMPLFITDTLELLRNRFTVVYDNVQVTNVHLDISYQVKDDIRFILGGDYFSYVPSAQLQVWYHPTLKVNLLGEYTILKKYIVKAEVFYVNQQYAPEMVDGIMTAKQLDGYPDLNLGVDYKYNKFLTAFLHLNNLASTAYYQWDNYPTQRFNFLLGVRLTF